MSKSKRKTVVLRAGMTHQEAWNAVRAVWPLLDLLFYRNTPGYSRDGSQHPDTATAPTDVLTPVGSGPGEVRIAGDTIFDGLVRAVFGTFGVMPEITYDLFAHRGAKDRKDHSTVAALQAEAEKQRAAFTAKHGREPTPADRIYQDGCYGFG